MKTLLPFLAAPLLALPRPAKRFIALAVDAALCLLAVWLAFYLRTDEFVSFTGVSLWAHGAVWAAVVSVGLALPIFVVSGLYRAIFRYSGWPALLAVARAVGVYGLLYATLFTAVGCQACRAPSGSSSRYCSCCSLVPRACLRGSG